MGKLSLAWSNRLGREWLALTQYNTNRFPKIYVSFNETMYEPVPGPSPKKASATKTKDREENRQLLAGITFVIIFTGLGLYMWIARRQVAKT